VVVIQVGLSSSNGDAVIRQKTEREAELLSFWCSKKFIENRGNTSTE
jgi:hypothetical protein